MNVHGSGGQHKLLGYLGIGQALCYQLQYFYFACRQARVRD